MHYNILITKNLQTYAMFRFLHSIARRFLCILTVLIQLFFSYKISFNSYIKKANTVIAVFASIDMKFPRVGCFSSLSDLNLCPLYFKSFCRRIFSHENSREWAVSLHCLNEVYAHFISNLPVGEFSVMKILESGLFRFTIRLKFMPTRALPLSPPLPSERNLYTSEYFPHPRRIDCMQCSSLSA